MRATLSTCAWLSSFAFVIGCGGKKGDNTGDDDNAPDACVGLECNVVHCGQMQLPPTSLSGTVFAPNGTLPLNGVTVYVPRDPLPPFTEGVTCDRCSTTLPGSAITQTVSDATGHFKLDNVPSGVDVPLVITTGKWRRVVTIPGVAQCTDTPIVADQTRLPKNKSEGDIPKIALSTGSADSLECLVRKLGIDDSEVTIGGGTGRVHYFHGNGRNSVTGSGNMTESKDFLWKDVNTLSQYDIVFLSCEGAQNDNTKPQAALDALEAYADKGGRVFASHWHNIWIGGNFEAGNGNTVVQKWKNIATWNANDGDPGSPIFIDEVSNPKGSLFADWMLNVEPAQPRDQIVQTGGTARHTALTLDTAKAERWVQTMTASNPGPAQGGPQMFQFTSPIDVTPDMRCGKVVFTDMHVSGNGAQNAAYPGTCGSQTTPLSQQEKALAFMFFDIASCVGGLF